MTDSPDLTAIAARVEEARSLKVRDPLGLIYVLLQELASDAALVPGLMRERDRLVEANESWHRRVAADEARDACAKELEDVKRRLVETDTLVACLRGSYLMQNHLPALTLEGEDFARAFLRLTKASIERFRVHFTAAAAGKKDAPQT